MTRQREPMFFECSDCRTVTLLAAPEAACPGCRSENGRVVSTAELERNIEAGTILNIDLRTGGGAQRKCGWKRPREQCTA